MPAAHKPDEDRIYSFTQGKHSPAHRLSDMVTSVFTAYHHADALRRADDRFTPRQLATFERAYVQLGDLYVRLQAVESVMNKREGR